MKSIWNKDFDDEEEYLGNIFGWKISLIGLVVILAMLGLVIYGHLSGKVDYRTGEPIKKQETTVVDTLNEVK